MGLQWFVSVLRQLQRSRTFTRVHYSVLFLNYTLIIKLPVVLLLDSKILLHYWDRHQKVLSLPCVTSIVQAQVHFVTAKTILSYHRQFLVGLRDFCESICAGPILNTNGTKSETSQVLHNFHCSYKLILLFFRSLHTSTVLF